MIFEIVLFEVFGKDISSSVWIEKLINEEFLLYLMNRCLSQFIFISLSYGIIILRVKAF